MPVKDNSVGFVVDYTDITGKLAGARTRKKHEKREPRRDERKRRGDHSLANALQVKHPRLGFAFANTIAECHDPNTRRQSGEGHVAFPFPN